MPHAPVVQDATGRPFMCQEGQWGTAPCYTRALSETPTQSTKSIGIDRFAHTRCVVDPSDFEGGLRLREEWRKSADSMCTGLIFAVCRGDACAKRLPASRPPVLVSGKAIPVKLCCRSQAASATLAYCAAIEPKSIRVMRNYPHALDRVRPLVSLTIALITHCRLDGCSRIRGHPACLVEKPLR
jgi:hypothetical protein